MRDISSIKRLAELSRIHMSEEELSQMAKDMESITALMDSIKTVELPPERQGDSPDTLELLRGDMPLESLVLPELSFVFDSESNPVFRIPRVVE
jgi:aspartyl/glutamyl-tRNA(Asn/Gln) amidotransferase C subunit